MTAYKGKLVYKLLFPKAKKGGHTVKPVKTEPTLLFQSLLQNVQRNEAKVQIKTFSHFTGYV